MTMIRKQLSVLPQYLAPQRLLTDFAGWLSERRSTWFKNWQINYLIKKYGANLQEAQLENIADYPTFNSFFTRHLKPELRPIASAPTAIASPADGAISQIGAIRETQLLQAKGFDYSLADLLASEDLAKPFINGEFATIYLSPKDYHRVHMPFTGTLTETIFIPGKLFSVNQKTANHVPRLFARNERLVCLFDTAAGPMAVILVGAMLVGSICTVWNGVVRASKITHQTYPTSGSDCITLERGAELGHFKMGSTVIILLPKGAAWLNTLAANSVVRMGELLGNLSLS